MSDFGDRIRSEGMVGMRVTIDMLVCKDCKFRLDDSKIYGNTTQCKKYLNHSKPNPVLKGGPCARYVKGKLGTTEYERIKGALYGFAIGDAMGATTEFMTAEEVKKTYGVLREIIGGGWLDLPVGSVTDDTEMTLCVYEAMKKGYPDIPTTLRECCKQFRAWADKGPQDIGNCCREAIYGVPDSIEPEDWIEANKARKKVSGIRPLGNGGLMRGLVPCLVGDLELACQQAYLTHTDPEQRIQIRIYGKQIKSLMKGKQPTDFPNVKMDPTGHVVNTCNNARYWLGTTESFEAAIVGAVNDGGDADTIAALVGGLAGAYYGFYAIPNSWIDQLTAEIKEKLEEICEFIYYTRL